MLIGKVIYITDSSLDLEDENSGPTKEEFYIVQGLSCLRNNFLSYSKYLP